MWVQTFFATACPVLNPVCKAYRLSSQKAELEAWRVHFVAPSTNGAASRYGKWMQLEFAGLFRSPRKCAPRKVGASRAAAMSNSASRILRSVNAVKPDDSERGKSVQDESVKILDMEGYFSGENDKVAKFCEQLKDQCHKVGFFYVKNHGLSEELCDSMLEMASRFFDLSDESKMELDYKNSAQFRGYMKIGAENTAGVTDFREQIEIGPDEPEDIDVVDEKEIKLVHPFYRRLRGPNQWPPEDTLPSFRRQTQEFMHKMNELSMHLMQALAVSLGLGKEYFDSTFLHMPHYQMKVVRYPPKPECEDAGDIGMLGVGAHSDSGFLSLLLQDHVGGLQYGKGEMENYGKGDEMQIDFRKKFERYTVEYMQAGKAQTTDGKWIDVLPERGTFVVNLGEMLQLATGGYYLATVHRVVSQSGNKSRYSVPFFFNPRLDTDIRAFNIVKSGVEISGDKSPPVRVSLGGLSTHGGGNKLLPVFGQNAFKSFVRSHVDVVRKHHEDLVQIDGSIALYKLELDLTSEIL